MFTPDWRTEKNERNDETAQCTIFLFYPTVGNLPTGDVFHK
jgi:hypothetical protein